MPINASKILNDPKTTTLHQYFTPSKSNQPAPAFDMNSSRKRKTKSPPGLPPINTENVDLNSVAMGINALGQQLLNIQDTLNSQTVSLKEVGTKAVLNERSIVSLKSSNNFLLQSRLNDRIEIAGLKEIPHTDKADFRSKMLQLLRDMNIPILAHEMVDAYPRKLKINDETRYLVTVIFNHEAVKTRVIGSKLQSKSTMHNGIFFNEVLTQYNRSLIYQARQMKRDGKFAKVGSFNGRVYVTKANDSQKIYVNNLCEMEEIAKLSSKDISDRLSNETID